MAMTAAMPVSRSRTPRIRQTPVHWDPPAPEPVATPVGLDFASRAFIDALEGFNVAFGSDWTQELVRIVRRADSLAPDFATSVYIDGLVRVVTVGDSIDLDSLVGGADGSHPLRVFDSLRSELGVTQKDLFTATGVKHRTYHSWKSKPAGSRTRRESVGRLFHLADSVADIREALGNVDLAAWLRASDVRYEALLEGRFDDLVDLAWAIPKPSGRSVGTSSRVGIASEVDLPIIRSTEVPRTSRAKQSVHR